MIELCVVCLASGHVRDDRLTVLITLSLQLIRSDVALDARLPLVAKGHHRKYGKVNVQ